MDLEKIKAILREEEGLRLTRYIDSLGNPTIGYGHQRRGLPETCTFEQAEVWLHEDVQEAITRANWFYSDLPLLAENRQAALVCMAFQLGARQWGFKKLRAALIDKDWDRAADEMLDSQWHNQTPGRCERMARMMREG